MGRMPWGKYQGQLLQDVPLSYLAWLLETSRNLDLTLSAEIKLEIQYRLDLPPLAVTITKPPEEAFIKAWCRQMALQIHPDHCPGLSPKPMALLNELRDHYQL